MTLLKKIDSLGVIDTSGNHNNVRSLQLCAKFIFAMKNRGLGGLDLRRNMSNKPRDTIPLSFKIAEKCVLSPRGVAVHPELSIVFTLNCSFKV